MDISYAGGYLMDITRAATPVTAPKQLHCLAFLTLPRISRAGDTQQEIGGRTDYTGPSNKSYLDVWEPWEG